MSKPKESTLRRMLVCGAVSSSFVLYAGAASADMAAAKKWVDEEFQPSTLSKDQQMKEMEWFIHAAAPYKGMSIKVVRDHSDPRLRSEDARRGLRGDHWDSRHA